MNAEGRGGGQGRGQSQTFGFEFWVKRHKLPYYLTLCRHQGDSLNLLPKEFCKDNSNTAQYNETSMVNN